MLPHVLDIDAVQDVNGSRVLSDACSAWALPVHNTSHVLKRSEDASVLSPSFSRRCRVAGFTFIEMMIVFVILGIIFFFQAEDGIRDLTVTGVQTCALPI